MTRETEGWAVVDNAGRLLLWTMAYTESGCWITAEENFEREREEMQSLGYLCIRVRIVPLETD